MTTDQMEPITQRRTKFGENLIKIETAFAFFQKTAVNVDDVDRKDVIAQYNNFAELYELLLTEYRAMNAAMTEVFAKEKADKGTLPYTWTRFRTDVMKSDREIQIAKLITARQDFIRNGLRRLNSSVWISRA